MFGCDNLVVEKQNVTVFVNEGDERFPVYKCYQLRPGCLRDTDCVNWPVRYLGPCYCAGTSCMAVKKEGSRGKTATQLVKRSSPVGKFTDQINSLCSWRGGGCKCERGELEEVWPLGSILLRSTKTDKSANWVLILLVVVGVLVSGGAVYLVCKKSAKSKTKSA